VKRIPFDTSWPESVKLSHSYDELEFWGSRSDLGYTYSYENRFKITIDLVKRAATPPARILDLAAAQGNFSLALAELGYDVVWNDLRAELVTYVRQKHEFGSIEYLPGNIFDLPVEEIGLFDVVLASQTAQILQSLSQCSSSQMRTDTYSCLMRMSWKCGPIRQAWK